MTCKECLHVAVCGRYAATGGRVRDCEHFAGGSRWIPVTERLPETYLNCYVDFDGSEVEYEDSEYVLVLTKFGEYGIDMYENSDAFIGWASTDDVTHWMPLPKPPKEVE